MNDACNWLFIIVPIIMQSNWRGGNNSETIMIVKYIFTYVCCELASSVYLFSSWLGLSCEWMCCFTLHSTVSVKYHFPFYLDFLTGNPPSVHPPHSVFSPSAPWRSAFVCCFSTFATKPVCVSQSFLPSLLLSSSWSWWNVSLSGHVIGNRICHLFVILFVFF